MIKLLYINEIDLGLQAGDAINEIGFLKSLIQEEDISLKLVVPTPTAEIPKKIAEKAIFCGVLKRRSILKYIILNYTLSKKLVL